MSAYGVMKLLAACCCSLMLMITGCATDPTGEGGSTEPAAFAGDEPGVGLGTGEPAAGEPETPADEPGPGTVVTPPAVDPPDEDPDDPVLPDPEDPEDPEEPDDPPPAGSGPSVASCFEGQMGGGEPIVDYDQFGPATGSHCMGTDHQDIEGVERVVFAGDSITVGTPPTPATEWYRNTLAVELADRFGLQAPEWAWQNVDIIGGKVMQQDSGDFASCAKWGARTDDLFKEPHQQLVTCNPPDQREKTTLIVITAGGNDLMAWAKDLVAGEPIDGIWAKAEGAVADIEEAIHWAIDDPETFPNGVFVVFANTYEFTDVDSGSDLATCPGANLIGMDTALINPEFSAVAAWFMAEYVRIAVDTGTDMVFLGEHFCGHGYMVDDPSGRCYRGPGAELWLDFTCMHPSGAGHSGITDLFLAVVDE